MHHTHVHSRLAALVTLLSAAALPLGACEGRLTADFPDADVTADADIPRDAETPRDADIPRDANVSTDADAPIDAEIVRDADAPRVDADVPDADVPDADVPRDAGTPDATVPPGPVCAEPAPPAPLVELPCAPIPAPAGCVAGPYAPVLRWSFDPGATTADSAGTRNVGSGLRAVADPTAVGGGFAFVNDPDVPQSAGSGTLVAAGSAATLELLVRFRTPLDWSGSAGAGRGGRTELLNLAASAATLELAWQRDEITFAVSGSRARFTMREGGVASWAALADGAFHHLAFTFTPRGADLEVALHVDGESADVHRATLTGTTLPAITRVSFGNRTYDPRGLDVDELGLYARALPATLIAQHAREAAARLPLSDMDACAPRTCTRPTNTDALVPALQAPGYDPAHLYAPSLSPTT